MSTTDPANPPGLEDLSDEELVALCRAEKPECIKAFHELLKRYESLVYHTCLRLLGQVQEAEETCQDVFLRLYQKIDQFEGRSLFKTWLFRVVHNLCLTRRRNLAIRRERIGEFEATAALDETERRATADSENGILDLSETVQAAIRKLKEDDQEILMLRFVSEMSLEDMAELLGTGLSATKMRLYRAMDRFKAVYLKLSDGEADLSHPNLPPQPQDD